MVEDQIAVGVIAEKRKSTNPWIEHRWSALAVVPGMPEAPRMTLIDRSGDAERYYLGASRLVLASTDTANYRDNLMSGGPKLWVVMRETPEDGAIALVTVTADPAEGEAHTESGSNLVDVVPMEAAIAGFVAAFVDANHVERAFFKRKRDDALGETRARRKRGDGSGQDA